MKTYKHSTLLIILTVGIISLTSCGEKRKAENTEGYNSKQAPMIKTHEEVMQEQLTAFEELADTIEDATDLESTKNAIPALTELGFKFNRLKTDLQNAAAISEDEKSELSKKYQTQRQSALARVSQHMKKLQSTEPEANRVISELMGSILNN